MWTSFTACMYLSSMSFDGSFLSVKFPWTCLLVLDGSCPQCLLSEFPCMYLLALSVLYQKFRSMYLLVLSVFIGSCPQCLLSEFPCMCLLALSVFYQKFPCMSSDSVSFISSFLYLSLSVFYRRFPYLPSVSFIGGLLTACVYLTSVFFNMFVTDNSLFLDYRWHWQRIWRFYRLRNWDWQHLHAQCCHSLT
jgi:hypothetical protein